MTDSSDALALPETFDFHGHAEVQHAYVTPWTGESGQAAFYRQIAQMDQRYTDAIEVQLASIRCPVQLLWGEEDQ